MRASWPALAILLLSCGGEREAPRAAPLETVDVTDRPDARADLATDGVARPPAATEQGVAGALPADFPRDVPLPQPSSLVDFAARSVTLEVQQPQSVAREGYLARLRAAGFRVGADGVWQKGARRLRVGFANASGATRVTIELV